MSTRIVRHLATVTMLAVVLGACASNVPLPLREAVPDAPSQRAVYTEPERYVGRNVRWGGEILGVRNAAGSTEVEVYSRPLFDDGEPRPEGGEGVRFIARVGGFLDPAEYQPGKRFTVRGNLAPAIVRPVGEYPYRYPVVDATVHHLWPAYERPRDPYWANDPFYDPWWPWGPWGPWGPYRHWPYGW